MKTFSRITAVLALLLVLAWPARAADERMKPVYGTWMVDLEATRKENALLSPQLIAAALRDYDKNPFTLTITEDEYISKSKLKTMVDGYRIEGVEGQTIVLALKSKDRESPDGRQRRSSLIPKNGGLLVRIDTIHLVYVLKRVPEGEPKAQPKGEIAPGPAGEKRKE